VSVWACVPPTKLLSWEAAIAAASALQGVGRIVSLTLQHRVLLLLVTQGTGQIAHAATAGDGFITDPAIISSYKGKKFSTTRYTLDGKCVCVGGENDICRAHIRGVEGGAAAKHTSVRGPSAQRLLQGRQCYPAQKTPGAPTATTDVLTVPLLVLCRNRGPQSFLQVAHGQALCTKRGLGTPLLCTGV
jgi:hypothetical protein